MSTCVVMSTYNGAQYLRDQIDSILVQDIDDLTLCIRDDGSTDKTQCILRDYERAGLATIIYGNNVGVASSFFDCLRQAPRCDYYAFSDQDDLWLCDKLSRAVSLLEARNEDGPLLYCSELNYCTEDLDFNANSRLNKRGVAFNTQLYETICSGNTMVFNEQMRELILSYDWNHAFLHDWWTSLLACSFGTVVWDDESRIMYRRLAQNTSPSGKTSLALQVYRIRKILMGGQMAQIQQQLESLLLQCSDDLRKDDLWLLQRVTRANRFVRAATPKRLRQKVQDELLLRLSMVLGLI